MPLKPPLRLLVVALLVGSPVSFAQRVDQQADQPKAAAVPAKPAVVCLKLAMHCFERIPQAESGSKPALDLSAPDVEKLIPTDQLQAMMRDEPEDESLEARNSVKVEGTPAAPNVPPGFAGLWWALKNPSQAWRLFTPVE